ncbi:hypothetical protein BDN72DRAFT_830342 [Pluteus cervinus]|uniref:Uncharacterized protein n=1 Tax=Pluteus cervinus TaxID=181527 RepID=A0ACD3BGM3_9AGAR|nr:hypothetical protein BDN72DRAFT_830342 [Pluteus cervinus]
MSSSSREIQQLSDAESSASSGEDIQSTDTEDEIENALHQKSRQTSKRKRRATGNEKFGATLESLLQTEAPSNLPLSLKPSIARKRNNEKLEEKARKVLQVEKKEKEDTARITDVIGGWGGESERALRKVAQRGVVKLFNAIQQSQAEASKAAVELKAQRGTGKPTLPAPKYEPKGKSKSTSSQCERVSALFTVYNRNPPIQLKWTRIASLI